MTFTNLSRLERWAGADRIQELSHSMCGWYGPPIALGGVPGEVYITGDGNFIGDCTEGFECSYLDRAYDLFTRASKRASSSLNVGFSGLEDMIYEATLRQNKQSLYFQKEMFTSIFPGFSLSLAQQVGQPIRSTFFPAVGTNGACDLVTNGTASMVGSLPFASPKSGNSLHVVNANTFALTPGALLLYDRLYVNAFGSASTTLDTVSHAPTRYQNTVTKVSDSVEGNFCFAEHIIVGGVLNTAHNINITYADQTGAAQSSPVTAGVVSAGLDGRVDHTNWYLPLAAGTTGIRRLNAIQVSIATTGRLAMVIGRPLSWFLNPVANLVCQQDKLNTAASLVRILPGAYLSLIDYQRMVSATQVISGELTLLEG